MTSSTAAIFVAILSSTVVSSAHGYRVLASSNSTTTATPTGVIDNRDFCMHEAFSARCQNGSLIMMLSALYGRMRLGRCINGDFNIGCSTDVVSYFDSHCTGRRSCDVSVRNLVDIHPCQRDFTSFLDASYRCIRVDSSSLISKMRTAEFASRYVSSDHNLYKLIIAGLGLPECPADKRVIARGSSGYLAHLNGHVAVGVTLPPSPLTFLPRVIGTESCPWTVVVHPGQTVSLRVIVLPPESTTGSSSNSRGSGGNGAAGGASSAAARVGSAAAAAYSVSDSTLGGGASGCAMAFVIREPIEIVSSFDQSRHRQQYSVCAGTVGGKSRERHLYTSAGNTVTIHVASTRSGIGTGQRHVGGRRRSVVGESSSNLAADLMFNIRFIISFEAIGCPDMVAPPRAWLTRSGDNIVMRCNDTHETWYLTCQRGRWLGDAGNCSSGMQPLQHDEAREESIFPSHGIMMAVLTGVTLGMVMGMVLLVVVHFARNRSRSRRKPRSEVTGSSPATPTVVKLSACRGPLRTSAAATEDCSNKLLYSCGRPPSATAMSMSNTYFRHCSNNEDDADRLLFPLNGNSAAASTRFQKAAVVYEFSCPGLDCPPSSTTNACDLLSRSMNGDQTDVTACSTGGVTSGSISPTAGGDARLQVVDLWQRTGGYSQQSTSRHHRCVMAGDPNADGGMSSNDEDIAHHSATLQLMRGGRRCDIYGNNQQPQLVLYETSSVGVADGQAPNWAPSQCDFRGYVAAASHTHGNGLADENGVGNRTIGSCLLNTDDELAHNAETCDALVFN